MEEPRNNLNISILNRINTISNEVLEGKSSILNSVNQMNELTRKCLIDLGLIFSKKLNLNIEDLPFALCIFGSPSRNLMLPNSDLDIGIIYTENCTEEIKAELAEYVKSLPFDKVDIASWNSISSMSYKGCIDMIEYNKAVDAQFVTGNKYLKEQYINEIKLKDSIESKSSRFITEYGILREYDYIKKGGNFGPNLKYDFGASRDIVFFDWFYCLFENPEVNKNSSPLFLRSLKLLVRNEAINATNFIEIKRSIELILLVKFTLLYKFRNNNNIMLLSLSSFSLQECFNYSNDSFKKIGIYSDEDLISRYYRSKLIIHNAIESLYEIVTSINPDFMKKWNKLKESQDLILPADWSYNIELWQHLVPQAIHSTNSNLLSEIVDLIANVDGFEYILRIISENKSIDQKIVSRLINSKLPEKYKSKLLRTYAT